jgi:subtilisin family serine protease
MSTIEQQYLTPDYLQKTRLSRQWHLHEPATSGLAGIDAVGAWGQREVGKPEIRIVVFDTGVDIDHPNLKRNIDLRAARDFDHGLEEDGRALTEEEIAGLEEGTLDGTRTRARISNPYDAHGTACAGIVAAYPIEGGCVGVAPSCTIVPVRINTNLEFRSLIAALKYADEAGHVILMPRWLPWAGADPCKVAAAQPGGAAAAVSAGEESGPKGATGSPTAKSTDTAAEAAAGEHEVWQELKAKSGEAFWAALAGRAEAELSATLHAAVREVAKRKPIVCASGNNGTGSLIYPACLAETVAVGACNEKGYRSTYSQYGAGLDVVAPSSDIADLTRTVRRATEQMVRERGEDPADPEVRERYGVDRLGSLGIETTDHSGPFGYNPNPSPRGDYCEAVDWLGMPAGADTPAYGQPGLAESQAGFQSLLAAADAADAARPDWELEDFRFGGTSAAAAQVAGVIALMLSKNPNLSMTKIKEILHATASLGHLKAEPADVDRAKAEFGAGLVNAKAAVAATPDPT